VVLLDVVMVLLRLELLGLEQALAIITTLAAAAAGMVAVQALDTQVLVADRLILQELLEDQQLLVFVRVMDK
jgi:hypothetical protein